MATTGEKLALYMQKNGISKRWLSRETGIYMNTITRIINGDKVGTLYTWLALVDAMNCSIDDVLNIEDGLQQSNR